jgi:hypothetical protein
MSALRYIVTALQIGAAVAALFLARRREDHRPFAVFFVGTTAANLLRFLRHETFAPIRPLGSPPFVGAARVAFHMDEALFLAWPAAFAALAIWLFAQRRALALLPAFAWVVAVAYLATHYPAVRGEALRRFYLGAELGALAVAVSSIASLWWRHGPIAPAGTCLLCCIAVDGGTLFAGAWRWGFWSEWALNQTAFALLYVVLIAFQGVLWSRLYRSQ